ncbi:MAG: penicillin acylase family protein [SAR202 cluster bacterium]|nr:penicillin acylase family protein [SAR202 cluster bacterium]
MKSFELHVARALPRCACHWLNLGTLLCLSWAIAVAAPAVELLRDSWGTPHIFATTETDGFFGLGYAAAEDRLLQMELIRRKAAGRLAEVFGPDWVDADREARIAGHTAYAPRAFAQLHRRPRRRNRRPIVQSLLHEPRDRGRVPALVKHLPGRRIGRRCWAGTTGGSWLR